MVCDDKRSEDEKYEVYLAERAKLIQLQAEETHKFDKAILTLAGGAFGFSLAFIKEFVPYVRAGTYFWLLAAWICFGLSLLSTMISFLTSQRACRTQIEIMEKDFFDDKKPDILKNKPARWTSGLNISSVAFFIVGVSLLIVFVAVNVPH